MARQSCLVVSVPLVTCHAKEHLLFTKMITFVALQLIIFARLTVSLTFWPSKVIVIQCILQK